MDKQADKTDLDTSQTHGGGDVPFQMPKEGDSLNVPWQPTRQVINFQVHLPNDGG
jgi:hypothetical protein